jgi:homoserine kinase
VVLAITRMATEAAALVYAEAGESGPPVASYRGDLPVGRGLGMSAASRAAGLVGANELLGRPLTDEALVGLAVRLEGHGDNIIPALFGGLRVVVHRKDGELVHVGVPPPDDLRLALLIPEFSMPTEESRRRLPASLTRQQAVHNIGRAALTVAALTQHRYDALRTSVEDVLHQPARGEIFPAMPKMIAAAQEAGAYGAYLSGGGSTIAAFVSPDAGDVVAAAMAEVARAEGLAATTRVVGLRAAGTEVVER